MLLIRLIQATGLSSPQRPSSVLKAAGEHPDIAPSRMICSAADLSFARKGSLFIGGLGSKAFVCPMLDGDRLIGEQRLVTKLRERIRDVRQGLDSAVPADR